MFLSTETISGEIGKVQLSAFFEILSSALVGLSDAERQRTFLMIDEAAGSSFLKGLVNLVANARRKKICIALAIQDIAFLEDSFGKGKAGVLQTNLCNHIYFQQNCGEAAEKIARISGTVSKEEVQETMQVGPSDLRGGESFSKVTKETLKIPASQIQNLKERQAFLKLYGFSQIAKIRFPKMRVPFANPKFVPGKIDKVCSEEKTENEDMKKTKETKPENKKTIKKESKTPMYGPLKTAAKKSVKPIEEKEGGEFV